jgi:hypothetical protein
MLLPGNGELMGSERPGAKTSGPLNIGLSIRFAVTLMQNFALRDRGRYARETSSGDEDIPHEVHVQQCRPAGAGSLRWPKGAEKCCHHGIIGISSCQTQPSLKRALQFLFEQTSSGSPSGTGIWLSLILPVPDSGK